MVRMIDYPMVLLPLDKEEGGGYFVYFPDLPGCVSDGETADEAFANARDAFEEWIDIQTTRSIEVPAPGDASRDARQRERRYLDMIGSLAEELKDTERENRDLNRKLAELIAILKTPDSAGSGLVPRDTSAPRPRRAH